MPPVIYSTGKPNKPTLTASSSNPTDGNNLVLTCTTTTGGINSYQFVKNGLTIQNSASATLIFTPAVFVTNDGTYTCVAVKAGTISSDSSNSVIVACELFPVQSKNIFTHNIVYRDFKKNMATITNSYDIK